MILNKAKLAQMEWDKFADKHKEDARKFKRFFHIRPCASYVTIVTTHSDRDFAMRGVRCAPTKLGRPLKLIADAIDGDKVDWKKIAGVDNGLWNFDKRTDESITRKRETEFAAQAEIINDIISGRYPFKFVASEFIIHETTDIKRDRIDIVAQGDDGKIIFIEVKAEGSKEDAKAQVLRYIDKYSKREGFAELLKKYPIYHIKQPITGFIGKVTNGTSILDLSIELPHS